MHVPDGADSLGSFPRFGVLVQEEGWAHRSNVGGGLGSEHVGFVRELLHDVFYI